ncbi:hypothetical protein EVH07_12640 [Salmonella enterica subsp. enterica serovar Newport]|nr:hypothetical protein [Salmonella enterica subsp. enterica serovar Newport]
MILLQEAEMRNQPFVYHLLGKDGSFYFGSRTKLGAHPLQLFTSYFTSSQTVKEIISKKGSDFFDVIFVELFDSPEDAYWKEQKLISEHSQNPLCLNLMFQPEGCSVANGRAAGPNHHRRGKPGWLKGKKGKEHPMNGRKGSSHPVFGINPWDTGAALLHNTRPMWLKSGDVYLHWLKTGDGCRKIARLFSIKENTAMSMINKFKEGWNPYNDSAWVLFCKLYHGNS